MLVQALWTLALAGAVCYYLCIIRSRRQMLAKLPSPPASSWFLGHAREVMGDVSGTYPNPALSWLEEYGCAYYFRLLHLGRVALADPVGLKHVLVTHASRYPRDDTTRTFLRTYMSGDSLVSVKGADHASMRKALNPHFGLAHLKLFVPIFVAHTNAMLAHFTRAIDTNTPVNLHKVWSLLTLDIMGSSMFGYDFGALAGTNAENNQAYVDAQFPPSIIGMVGTVLVPGWSYLPLPGYARRRRAIATLPGIVMRVIEAKMAQAIDDHPPQDLLDLMLISDRNMTSAEARVHVQVFMQAGHETTSHALSWAIAMLLRYPNVAAKVQAECDATVARFGSDVSYEAVADLVYVTAFLKETARCYPAITMLAPRSVTIDDVIPLADGSSVANPKGTSIYVDLVAVQRNSKYWTRPNDFCPERFMEGSALSNADRELRGGAGHTFHYLPFSMGEKNCIGQRFAMLEMQILLVKTLAAVTFKATDRTNLNPSRELVSITPTCLEVTVHRRSATTA
ncbi:hypothetical protein SDRG_02961 [Saprolegnia diclina VS20]|uniref:Cytochrome P450 n=1 Tax=Saprolegnia diclina (strain VS20) TaxID=1156394 RepID=T0S3C6_SAPDV|nr:hypothetical protein SDRG_02961 [Saprolegnia diclina VS20]EQC39523.1 hypothetical protein SDRG_02961 [Saprolegnia diclina VS20]|eukprot:XP_008606795.1 hypothetical protein SDRG_02961 [Saprolegnia diclina VS20]